MRAANSAKFSQQPRVLVVDDDEPLVRLIRLTLVSEDFEVKVAQEGKSGLEALATDDFDLVVLDLQMPGMDGRAMFKEMRSRGHTLPVLILSAFGAERARLELDAEAAMDKPFDIDALVDRIRAMLRLERTGKE